MVSKPLDQWLRASPPENYQRYFVPTIGAPLAQDLLGQAELQAGERVLDVGCGTGVVTRMAAGQVGEAGSVAGLDPNPGMLAVARSAPQADGIEWQEAGAEAIPYSDASFDVVLCQLSLQFVPDRGQALREMHRVLAPGGRVHLNVPGPAGPVFGALADALERHVAPEAAGFVRAVFSLHDEAEIAGLMEGAGFGDVRIDAYTRELGLPASGDFLWQYVASTPLAGAVAKAGPEALAALEHDVLAAWAEHEGDDGLTCRQRVVLASAHR